MTGGACHVHEVRALRRAQQLERGAQLLVDHLSLSLSLSLYLSNPDAPSPSDRCRSCATCRYLILSYPNSDEILR